jgi:hypothetical protein
MKHLLVASSQANNIFTYCKKGVPRRSLMVPVALIVLMFYRTIRHGSGNNTTTPVIEM